MNELYIYKNLQYKKILKQANKLFSTSYKTYLLKSVFAIKDNTYTVSINKNSIHICYWDENTELGNESKKLLEKFLIDNFAGNILVVSKFGNCDILNNLHVIDLM